MSGLESRVEKLELRLKPGQVFALFDDEVVLLSSGVILKRAEFDEKFANDKYLIVKRLEGCLLEAI